MIIVFTTDFWHACIRMLLHIAVVCWSAADCFSAMYVLLMINHLVQVLGVLQLFPPEVKRLAFTVLNGANLPGSLA